MSFQHRHYDFAPAPTAVVATCGPPPQEASDDIVDSILLHVERARIEREPSAAAVAYVGAGAATTLHPAVRIYYRRQ